MMNSHQGDLGGSILTWCEIPLLCWDVNLVIRYAAKIGSAIWRAVLPANGADKYIVGRFR